jgi:hypothetical protein
LFSSRNLFLSRVPKINQAVEEFSAEGFRAAMVHRNLAWLQDLSIRYDASCFDIDPFQAMPGGVGGIWPFKVGSLIELPYTLPQDHTLLALGQPLLEVWTDKLRLIRKWSGMALMLTHPDYLDSSATIDSYTSFLQQLNEQPGIWRALPREITCWWIDRDQSSLSAKGIVGPANSRGHQCNLASLKLETLEGP